MRISETELPGVLLIEPDVYEDARGFFLESWNEVSYTGIPNCRFVQHNHSRSKKDVLRGLHYQLKYPQAKLVQVTRGAVFDVSVDIRVGSPTFGHWEGHEISDENHRQIWVPAGFAHGFLVLSESADFTYQCTELYRADDDRGILWNDSDIGIDWPTDSPILSDKDRGAPSLAQAEASGQLPRYAA